VAAIAAAVATVEATRTAVAAAAEKAAAVGGDATDFRLKIIAVPFDSRANRAGKRLTLTNTRTQADATTRLPLAGRNTSKEFLRLTAAENGWLQFP
jgi:hypothetical protein